MLWSREEAARGAGGRAGGAWPGVDGVSIDTRTLSRGDLFVALEDARDGHDFVADALERGAGAAMVARRPAGLDRHAPLLRVGDTLHGLASLGNAARDRARRMTAIAVTGSVGKTSVKNALAFVLARQGLTHAAEKSYNNHWGVPLTLSRTPANARFGIYEIGMNHAGEIEPLTHLVRPDIAIVTTIAPAHIGHFASEAAIAEAKAEIFAGLGPGGVALINADNRWSGLLMARARAAGAARVIGFGAAASAGARLLSHQARDDRSIVEAGILGRRVLFKLTGAARAHALNGVAVLTAAALAGADLGRAAVDLAAWSPGEGRGARWRVGLGAGGVDGAFLLIDESYNANPASIEAALEGLVAAPTGPGGRRIALLGDMLELGDRSEALHAGLARIDALRSVETVHAAGPAMRALHGALPLSRRGLWAPDAAALCAGARKLVHPGDVVMVKGSLGSRMGSVVAALCKLGVARPVDAARDREDDGD